MTTLLSILFNPIARVYTLRSLILINIAGIVISAFPTSHNRGYFPGDSSQPRLTGLSPFLRCAVNQGSICSRLLLTGAASRSGYLCGGNKPARHVYHPDHDSCASSTSSILRIPHGYHPLIPPEILASKIRILGQLLGDPPGIYPFAYSLKSVLGKATGQRRIHGHRHRAGRCAQRFISRASRLRNIHYCGPASKFPSVYPHWRAGDTDFRPGYPVIVVSKLQGTDHTREFTGSVKAISTNGSVDCPVVASSTTLQQRHALSRIVISVPQTVYPFLFIVPGEGEISDIMRRTDPIPLSPGSHLSVLLTWTHRRVISESSSLLLASAFPLRDLLTAEVNTIQPNIFPDEAGPNVSSLTLFQRETIHRDIALAGLATFGGIWTFVNGTFVLFFGASIVYFLFVIGKARPAPTLGAGTGAYFPAPDLVQKWNEDFPALRTEGGSPGTASAGIVAFIRERLVDLETGNSPPP
ncbi:hypothetical protein B0H13DRAFT_2269846 [Mycena leptocephala]|nr:hypothetical protein B0H13DRAFT_2269846 [Mycena leptocephala]